MGERRKGRRGRGKDHYLSRKIRALKKKRDKAWES